MVFHSFPFIFCFLPLVLVCFYVLSKNTKKRDLIVIAASVVFYAIADLQHIYVLAFSVALNFIFSIFLSKTSDEGKRRLCIRVAIVTNVAILGLYKYLGFFAANLGMLVGKDLQVPRLGFPLGVSFFTIQQIMFLMDRYEGMASHPGVLKYLKFVTFFPSISAGPISRLKEFKEPELNQVSEHHYAKALFLFAIGLAKKVVIADNFAKWADVGFSAKGPLSFLESWVASLSYTFQLYFDFSGYSDMAVAIAMAVLVILPQNFASPFKAASIIDFWKRWHITLSKFITTYLYAPMLRGRRKISFSRAMTATFIAMTIAGLWHGPMWTYVLFGALHGIGLVINHLWRKAKYKIPAWLGQVITFLFVNMTFVVFRSANLGQASEILKSMYCSLGFGYRAYEVYGLMAHLLAGIFMITGVIVAFAAKNSHELTTEFKPSGRMVCVITILLLVSMFYMNALPPKEFLYVDF